MHEKKENLIYLLFQEIVKEGNTDVSEHLIESLVNHDDIHAVQYWRKTTNISFLEISFFSNV